MGSAMQRERHEIKFLTESTNATIIGKGITMDEIRPKESPFLIA